MKRSRPLPGPPAFTLPHLLTGSASQLNQSLRLFIEVDRAALAGSPCSVRLDGPGIDPGGVLLLIHAARSLTRRCGTGVFLAGSHDAVGEVMKHVDHYRLPREQRALVRGDAAPGDFLLRGLATEREMATELSAWGDTVQRQAKMRASDEDVALWQTQIGEVVANGFQHGVTGLQLPALPDILVAGKAYENGDVHLAALDEGSGIPSVVSRAAGCPSAVDDGTLIMFACQSRVTSKCHRTNQGAGLATLVRTVRERDGLLTILSRNGLVHLRSNRMYRRNLARFGLAGGLIRGTLTILQLKIGAAR